MLRRITAYLIVLSLVAVSLTPLIARAAQAKRGSQDAPKTVRKLAPEFQ